MADNDDLSTTAIAGSNQQQRQTNRWTCEACGCRTNTETDDANSCGVCGTHRILGGSRNAVILSNNFTSQQRQAVNRHRFNRNFDDNLGLDTLLNADNEEEEHDHELEEVLEGEGEENVSIFAEIERRRLLRTASSSSTTTRATSNRRGRRNLSQEEADALYASAMENSRLYQPTWSNMHKGISIHIDSQYPNIAYLQDGAGEEGRCIRSAEAVPKKKNIGWKIVLEHTSREKGKNMGGCYLVGVTTGSFHGFGERSGLQSSRLFWGVEDGGRRYEGSSRGRENVANVPRNSENVLFGSLEVLSVIVDLENKTLNYWRDGVFLGSLVANLPKGASLYPVAVPFNAGVSVTICGLDKDPMQILSHYHVNVQKRTKERNEEKRVMLLKQRRVFLENEESLSPSFISVIKRIMSWYKGLDEESDVELDSIMAKKLWYRCGFSFEYLEDGVYTTRQFIDFLNRMVKEEIEQPAQTNSEQFEVGDKVEVLEGYERFGDAASGPLKVGDRGVIMELQRGGRGEKQSVRVEYHGRRWWYQPQALVSERTGLIESQVIRCLTSIARCHGFDSDLNPYWGKKVEDGKWKVGDLVVSIPNKEIGRIVVESGNSKRDGFVWVDFASVKTGPKKVKVDDLLFTTFFHSLSILPNYKPRPTTPTPVNTNQHPTLSNHIANIAKFDKVAIAAILRECKSSSPNLPNLFSAGLGDAILKCVDFALGEKEDSITPSSFSALGSLILNIMKLLFHPSATITCTEPEEEKTSSKSDREHNFPNVNVREFIRNLEHTGGDREHSQAARRSVFLALMGAGERNRERERHGERQGMSENQEEESNHSNYRSGRLFLSPFGPSSQNNTNNRNSNEESFGYSPSHEDESKTGTVLHHMLRPSKKMITSNINSLIMDGLLLNNHAFVVKTLSSTGSDLSKIRDGNNYTIFKLAIWFGCSRTILETLMKHSGVSTSIISEEGMIEDAAYTNQHENLEVLLRYIFYEDTLDISKCTPSIQKVITEAKERQALQEERLKNQTEEFIKSLLFKFLNLCWIYRWKKAHSQIVMEVLVGGSSLFLRAANGDTRMSLLESIPNSLMQKALGEESLSSYFRLVESYIWKKDLKDSFVGLLLILLLLQKAVTPETIPTLYEEIVRFGLLELTNYHIQLSEEALGEIDLKNSEPVVKCPQGHTTLLHMTKHSSFRCDLCGKGVDQNKPMHGCRECDWDACETCTDRREGGVVKWNYIKTLCEEIQSRLKDIYEQQKNNAPVAMSIDEEEEELTLLCSRITKRDVEALSDLKMLLDTNKITTWEFSICILPCLNHASFGFDKENDNKLIDQVNAAWRKTKKPKLNPIKSKKKIVDKDTFLKAAADVLLEIDGCIPMEEDEDDEDEDMEEEKQAKFQGNRQCSILQYLHTVLAFYERVRLSQQVSLDKTRMSSSSSPGELQSLLLPFEMELHKASGNCYIGDLKGSTVSMEPLMNIRELEKHVLRCCRITLPGYTKFCRRLAKDQAIIAEKPTNSTCKSSKKFFTIKRLAKVISYHEETGAHLVRYASSLGNRNRSSTNIYMEEDGVTLNDANIRLEDVEFNGREVLLILATRDYCILQRNRRSICNLDDDHFENDTSDKEFTSASKTLPVGLRVESDCHQTSPSSNCEVYTILSSSVIPVYQNAMSFEYEDGNASSNQNDSNAFMQDNELTTTSSSSTFLRRYNLVSDNGEVILNVSEKNIKGHEILMHKCYNTSSSATSTSASASSSRLQRVSSLERLLEGGSDNGPIGLFRSTNPNLFHFSRSSAAENNPMSQSSRSSSFHQKGVLRRTWSALSSLENMHPLQLSYTTGSETMSNNDSNEIEICTDVSTGEKPPHLSVNFSLHANATPHVSFDDANITLYHGLQRLIIKQHSIRQQNKNIMTERKCKLFYSIDFIGNGRRRQESIASEDEKNCDIFIEECGDSNLTWNSTVSDETNASFLENELLYNSPPITTWYSHHVISSSDNSKTALSKCEGLDETCVQCLELLTALASHSNHVVTTSPHARSDADDYLSAMFVSEALTNKLMEQLDDPLTVVGGALPDWCSIAPIYAPRIFSHASRRRLLERAAFGMSRAAFCQQESKVAVGPLRQRMAALRGRAVELVGEAFSGGAADPTALQLQADELYGMEEALAARVNAAFRAQKWDERMLQSVKATVRRNFLLQDAATVMEHYATDSSANRRRLEVRFEGESGFDAASGDEAGVTRGFYADVAEDFLQVTHNQKLPLWIADVDIATSKVIIPTPRADVNSLPGVFPRPLSCSHPLWKSVLKEFRFMGRLFAAAIRDGFRLPLPLSASFLKLVQFSSDEFRSLDYFTSPSLISKHTNTKSILTSVDLPRPGFLGGEIYAVENYFCKTLKKESPNYDIATDKNFARKVLGKSYDCSFNEYFENKCFVDPFDPSQDESSTPLCNDGHKCPVTIFNIHEYISLCKNFILRDGVLPQALAFRQGVNDFFSADALKLFTPQELQQDVCGCGDNVDVWDEGNIRALLKLDGGRGAAEALIAVAAIGGEGGAALSRRFGPSSPTIGFLVKALLDATSTQRRQFLTFVTSVPIITPGQIEVVPIVNPAGEFLPMADPGCLPRANTCARRLYLPKFENYDSFEKVFWTVVKGESRFKGFYEWRG